MKQGLVILLTFAVVPLWAQRPYTQGGAQRPVTSVSAQYPQTSVAAQYPRTSVEVTHPSTAQTAYPHTSVSVTHPQTSVSAQYPQTTASAQYPQTTVSAQYPATEVVVLHPQTEGVKSAPQVQKGRVFSQQGNTVPSSQSATTMSDFTPKVAKDFTAEKPQFGGGSLQLGNDTADEAAKNALAASRMRIESQESLEKFDPKQNPNALSGLEKMVTDRAKVEQKK